MHVLWIAASAASRKGGGGTIYAEGLQRALASAVPDSELVEAGTPGQKRTFLTWLRRQLISLARSLVSAQSSAALYHYHPHVAMEIATLARAKAPNLVVFDSTDSLVYRDIVPGPGLLVAHNVEGDIIAEKVRALPPPFRSIFKHMFRETEKYREFERSGARSMQGVITISAVDRAVFEEWLPGRPVVQILPCFGPAADAGRRRPSLQDASPVRIVFPAKFSWAPNRQGIDWFIKEIWPFAAPDTELHLFGDGSERYANTAQRIVSHGFVESVTEIWRKADISIVPTFAGSGLNIKMCEALYYGVPVVTTPEAIARLGFRPTAGVCECEGVEAWRLAMSGPHLRTFAAQHPLPETSLRFSDEAAAKAMRGIIDQVLAGPESHSVGSHAPPSHSPLN